MESDDCNMEKQVPDSNEPHCTCGLIQGGELHCTCGLIDENEDDVTEIVPSDPEVEEMDDNKLQRDIQVDSLEDISKTEINNQSQSNMDRFEADSYGRQNMIGCNRSAKANGVVIAVKEMDCRSDIELSSVTESGDTMPVSSASSDRGSQKQKSKLPVKAKTTEIVSDKSSEKFKEEKRQNPKTIIKYKTIDFSHVKPKIQSLPGNERTDKVTDGHTHPQKGKRQNITETHVQNQVTLTSNENHGIRETLTSRMRFEKKHASHDIPDCEGESYLTPTQRNEQQIKYMRKEIKELRCEIEEKNQEIEKLRNNIVKDELQLFEDKEKEIMEVMMELDTLKSENDKLRKSYGESVKTINALEETIRGLKETMEEKERKNEAIYLEMYKKGQDSARFEREEEIERLAATCSKKGDKTTITIKELMTKLNSTESELAKWQTFRRRESYDMGDKPETQADAILRFLKDSFFHYLTDAKDSENHLRAMIRIFSFTDVQKKKISAALATDRKIKS